MATAIQRIPLIFDCADSELVGMLHQPNRVAPKSQAVLIVVGGPQYRAGSHRQFLLLANQLAEAGYPTLRFDYRGMGDSEGPYMGFEHIGQDIGSAVDALYQQHPSLRGVTLWGLCDAASAIAQYAADDPRVQQLIMLNPWVRTEASENRTWLKHYYLRRLLDREFWDKLLRNELDLRSTFADLGQRLGGSNSSKSSTATKPTATRGHPMQQPDLATALPERMVNGLSRFQGDIAFILSGNDLTANEFQDACKRSERWKDLLNQQRVQREHLEHADHTFSRKIWREQVEQLTLRLLSQQRIGQQAA